MLDLENNFVKQFWPCLILQRSQQAEIFVLSSAPFEDPPNPILCWCQPMRWHTQFLSASISSSSSSSSYGSPLDRLGKMFHATFGMLSRVLHSLCFGLCVQRSFVFVNLWRYHQTKLDRICQNIHSSLTIIIATTTILNVHFLKKLTISKPSSILATFTVLVAPLQLLWSYHDHYH